MKLRYLNLLLLSLGVLAMNAGVPKGYYDRLDGLTGKDLRAAAREVVKNHTSVSYGSKGTWPAFEKTDVRVVNGKKVWWDMYSNKLVEVSTGHSGLNIEHSVPQSWFNGGQRKTDLHHLNPSDERANSAKGNYPMGEIKGTPTWQNGVTFVGAPVSGQGGGNSKVYEPADEYKGDFARIYFYMFTTYENDGWQEKTNWMYTVGSEDVFKPWAIELLLKWHRQDPVSQKEIDRNEAVYGIQKNRNPYVDSPELAEYVWGNKKGQPYSFSGEYVPNPNPDPDPNPNPDPDPNPNPDPEPNPGPVGVAGTWTLIESMDYVAEGDKYIIVAQDALVGMSIVNNKKSSNTFIEPTTAMTAEFKNGVKTISSVPSDIAVVTFSRNGSDYVALVSDINGKKIGYLNAQAAKKVIYCGESYTDGCDFSLNVSTQGAVLDFGSAGKLFYNASSPRFTTYTSTGQQRVNLYRFNEDSSSGIESVEETEGEPMVFTLQGVRVNGDEPLPAGLYIIVRPGKQPQKVMVK